MSIEIIGKAKVNLDYYDGKDHYTDGDIEDEMLELVQQYGQEKLVELVQNSGSWPLYYHLSPERRNVISWYPFGKQTSILEIGGGCGAITGELAKRGGDVTVIELSKKRSMINAHRHKDYSNLEIYVGNFEDIVPEMKKKYDLITLIGVFEYAESYLHTASPYKDLLEKANNLLEKDGSIFIAIENRMGLKYFAGCKEDHLGIEFEGINGYPGDYGVKTFSHGEWEEMLLGWGFSEFEFYYPYPDYKFPNCIYSDNYLPRKGELVDNIRNFDASRLVLFDESKVYDTLIQDNVFPQFSNSFILRISKKEETYGKSDF